jgi:lipopolysaccharide export system permease protein
MAGVTSAAASAWVPVIIAGSLALTVLLYKEDG